MVLLHPFEMVYDELLIDRSKSHMKKDFVGTVDGLKETAEKEGKGYGL